GGEFEAARKAVPVDRRDRRLARIQPRKPHRPSFVDIVVLEQGCRVLEVRASTKRQIALAGHDQDARPLVGGKRLDRLAEADGGFTVHSVALLRPVNAQNPQRSSILYPHLVCHSEPPMFISKGMWTTC